MSFGGYLYRKIVSLSHSWRIIQVHGMPHKLSKMTRSIPTDASLCRAVGKRELPPFNIWALKRLILRRSPLELILIYETNLANSSLTMLTVNFSSKEPPVQTRFWLGRCCLQLMCYSPVAREPKLQSPYKAVNHNVASSNSADRNRPSSLESLVKELS